MLKLIILVTKISELIQIGKVKLLKESKNYNNLFMESSHPGKTGMMLITLLVCLQNTIQKTISIKVSELRFKTHTKL